MDDEQEQLGGIADAADREPEAAGAEVVTATPVIAAVRENPDELTPEERRVMEHAQARAAAIRERAGAVLVRSEAEAEAATAFLGDVSRASRDAEDTRKLLVKPLNDHVKRINGMFKPQAEALDAAKREVGQRVLAWQREQEAAARAEQARLDAERAERERAAQEERDRQAAAAQAEREAAAREAEARAAAARRAAQEAEEARRREVGEHAAELGLLPESVVRYQAEHAPSEERREAARRLLEQRAAEQAAERAAQEAEAAQEAAREAREREEQQRALPAAEVPRTEVVSGRGPIRGGGASTATRKVWKHEVIDQAAVPETYKDVSDVRIRQAIRAGTRTIPGVRIFQDDELAVRA